MGFTYLRIYKSKSERIQRDKINQEKILKKRKRLKNTRELQNILGNWRLEFGCKYCKYVNPKSMEIYLLSYVFDIYSILLYLFFLSFFQISDL